jgi:ABC-2 type transport system permease protein
MTTHTIDPTVRRVPPLGGFNLTMLGIELKRMLRNRRTIIFTFVMPVLLYLIIGANDTYSTDREGSGNVSAYILISMAVYGAVLASTSGGAMVATERALGWSRQLRLTPMSPVAYIVAKSIVALGFGALSVAAVNVAGAVNGKADMPVHVWITAAVIAWLGSIVFGSFGLFMGYLLPSENVMQILGPVLAVLSFAGGLFVPVDQLGHTFATIAKFTPVYGVGEIARYPLTHDGNLWLAALNVVVWTALFAAGAMWRFRRDTARV